MFKKALHKESSALSKQKNELQIKQSSELIQAKSALSQLQRELRTGRQRSRESLGQLRSELRLELALEKGKQRDAAIGLLLKCEDLRGKIDGQVAEGRVALGKLRHDLFYSMTGFFFTSVAALFGYLRYIA
jgi:hypothetical protein